MSAGRATETNDTARLEAFSDGVFAVAITLLVLELKVPPRDSLTGEHNLLHALLDHWPSWFAFVTSFLTILVVWVNHHNVFKAIARTDQVFLLLNGLLLMSVTVIPFATSLLAEYLEHPQQRTAAVVYIGSLLLMAIAFNFVWRRATAHNRLLHPGVDAGGVWLANRSFSFGVTVYIVIFIVAFIVPVVSLVFAFLLSVFFALPVSASLIGGQSRAAEISREAGGD